MNVRYTFNSHLDNGLFQVSPLIAIFSGLTAIRWLTVVRFSANAIQMSQARQMFQSNDDQILFIFSIFLRMK